MRPDIRSLPVQRGRIVNREKNTQQIREGNPISVELDTDHLGMTGLRPFYGELVEYMSSGAIYAAILEKDNAVLDFRALIGATDPAEAAEGTIRKEFAESKAKNAVHGSDSDENAAIEAGFFFADLERF